MNFPWHGRPTLRAVDAAGAARELGAIYASRLVPPAVPVQTPASGATDAVRWASIRSADAGEPDIPGIFPGSRAYFRTAGQPGIFPGSRAYRTAGHISGQPGISDSRAYFRAAGHISGQPSIFPGSRAYRAAGHIFRAYFRAAGHTGQPDIPGSRASSEQEFTPRSEQRHNRADVPGNRTFFHPSYARIFC